MLSSVSGLGRLFNSASSSLSPHTPRGQRQLESVTEEAHTCDLLYPQAGLLKSNQHDTFHFRHGDPSSIAAAANSSDDRGGLNVQHPRDVRIIVGQYIGGNTRLIYDSQPSLLSSGSSLTPALSRASGEYFASEKVPQRQGSIAKSHTAPHSRQSSFSQVTQSIFASPGSPLSPVNELGSLLGNSRRPTTSEGENAQSMLQNEEAKETESMLSAMFGATGFRAESGTKIHVKPYTANESEFHRPTSPGNIRLGAQMRRTPLTRSTTTEDLQSMSKSAGPLNAAHQAVRRKSSSVLITRIFYVDPAEEDFKATDDSGMTEVTHMKLRTRSDPRPQQPASLSADDKTNQIRTPAFAVAMVLYLPNQQQIMKRSASARSSPALNNSVAPNDNIMQQISKELFDYNVEYVMAHWHMITRALASLEIVVRCQICNQLGQLDVHIPTAHTTTVPADSKSGARSAKMRPPPRPTLQLPASALQQDSAIQKAVEVMGKRVATCLQLKLVLLGQDRWGIWREEARGVGKWAGGREQGFFFGSLMTAFLGHQSEWLDIMGPRVLKASHVKRRRKKSQQQISLIRRRTVIISLDKMAARRLIFLLSSFIPGASSDPRWREASSNDPLTSVTTVSTSPSYSGSFSRRHSLRRNLQKPRGTPGSNETKEQETAVIDFDNSTDLSDDRTIVEDSHLSHHSRRSSDVRSIRSVALPIGPTNPSKRNSSLATTATMNPDFAVPVPHFSIAPEKGNSSLDWRPGSSGSIASLSLQRTLSRSESNDQSGTSIDSHSSGRWFWGSRRGSSTETSETPISSVDALGIYGLPSEIRDHRAASKLAQMVEDVKMTSGGHRTIWNVEETHQHGIGSSKPAEAAGSPPLPRDLFRSQEMEEPFPLDLSVNEEDGVIDVKLPPAGSQASSFGSIMNSPRNALQLSSSLKDRLATESRPSAPPIPIHRQDSHMDVFVGGWLRKFHPDLTLQAVQPYDTLKEEIKEAMRTEPTPRRPSGGRIQDLEGEWHDVSTSLVADTTKFTVTQITLRRRHPFSPHHQADALLGVSSKDNKDEEFREQVLTETDPLLGETVERVLSHSGQSSRSASRPASRPPSPRQSSFRSNDRPPAGLEIPKSECKKTMLGALEEIAKGVLSEIIEKRSEEQSQEVVIDPKERQFPSHMQESPLREGIQRWFVESMA